MIVNIEIRRASFFIFLSAFLTSILLIYVDSKKTFEDEYVSNLNLQIDKMEQNAWRHVLYASDIIVYTNNDNYKTGDIIEVSGRLYNLLDERNNTYNLYLKSKGYNYKLYADNIVKNGHSSSIKSTIYHIRRNISEKIDFLYDEYSAVIRALVIADRELLTKEDREIFSKLGISHIISISGFHIILISGIFYNMLFFMSKKQRYIISSVISFFYILLIGMTSSSVRAYIFFVSYIFSVFTEKRYDIFSTAFILSSIYMIINPYVIFDYGFCLSFIAVFSIAMFYKIILIKLKKIIKYKESESFLSLISLTISAQVLTFPYVAYNFKIISFISLISNMISVPLIAFGYVFILLSLLFSKFIIIAEIFANIVKFIIMLFYKTNKILLSLPYVYIELKKLDLLPVIIFYITVLCFYSIYIRKKIRKNMKNMV